jgi:ribosomal protein S18 acetylase RimI-like enzyme
MDPDLIRAFGFEAAMRERCSTGVVPFRWGTAFLNSDYPKVYDMNYLRADGDLTDATAEALIAEADRVLDGYEHREMEIVDEVAAERLRPGFEAAGWSVFRALFMVLRRDADRASQPGIGEQVEWAELRPTVLEQVRSEPYATSEEVVVQLTDRRDVLSKATNLRHFGARADGRIVSYCDLYSDGVVAQIEEVSTLEAYRNRGFARAVVEAAAATALVEDHEMVFLVADEDDWPKSLYARLGFDSVGTVASLRLFPPVPSGPSV